MGPGGRWKAWLSKMAVGLDGNGPEFYLWPLSPVVQKVLLNFLPLIVSMSVAELNRSAHEKRIIADLWFGNKYGVI